VNRMAAKARATAHGGEPGRALGRAAASGVDRVLWWSGLLLVPVLWQVFAAVSESPLVVGPVEVAGAAVVMIGDGRLLDAAASSALVFALGILAGTAAGLVVGILVGRFRSVDVVLDPYISALYATPLVAVIPILVVALGFGVPAKIVIVSMFAFFPVALNTAAGVRNIPADLDELARSFCSSELAVWRDVLIPGALPYIVTGLRLAVGRALIAVVVAEFSTAVTGLGFLILRHSRRFQMAEALVPVVLLMLAGFVLYSALKRAERRLGPWMTRDG